ncbi:MAG: site-specific DNA-methyltransferase [Selenomonadaceae bacterium]|nr:site-specific DNA-methyltransferase [Selenomonadaceae bacterium]
MANFFEHLIEVLKQDKKYFSEDGKFFRNAAVEAANKLDPNFLKILLADPKTAKIFFEDVEGVKVFDKVKFGWVINNREFLPGSYTRFKNKIGLVDSNGDFISESGNVEMVFPYKDCVLEGGQTKDDQKRSEIFYNELLASDDVDRLFEPKVLTCAKKFSADGVETVTNFSDTDNLIMKGNNLLALASLLPRFQNKIKCIYIDVPYNTGNDSFGYNDRFNHSSWLTFMKNRLELAKKLLRNDGSIWISIDDDEQAYLKILCDEIFGRENFVCNVIWEKKYSPQNDAKYLSDCHDFILVYAKNKKKWRPNLLPRTDEMNARYSNPDNDPRGVWTSADFTAKRFTPADCYPITTPTGKIIYPTQGRSWISSKKTFDELVADNRIWFGADGNNVPRVKKFLSEVQQGLVSKTLWKIEEVGDNQESKKEIKALNLAEVFTTPKPERLIERILTLATVEGDIVLDNFLGSGTTAAVAHKMKRQYIGVEQMDYIETVTVERLKKVIAGEGGGISKAVNWSGGGSFIYCELAKLNQNFVEEIQAARDFETIWAIYRRMVESGYISYKVNPADIDAAVDDFKNLSLENQQRFLMELLDKNLLYVNYCDIDDEDFAISEADKKFSRSFYGEA